MTLQFTVPDMACSACATTITQAVNAIDPAATISADTKTKQVQIDTVADETTVKQAIVQAGYSPA
ncbi:MAG: heavy-metal-associated domain-containing protein [Leptolyngbyaceae cyanobacterium SM1_3_5]|nr:heavy-metal-associated domain-containing protein [Leptolyngbyaceae cyanobacterium SM1_3_5]